MRAVPVLAKAIGLLTVLCGMLLAVASPAQAASAPSAPAAPTLTVLSTTSLRVDWVPPASNGSTITKYVITYSTDPAFGLSSTASTTVASSPVTLTVRTGARYYVKVRAVNGYGSGASSDVSNALIATVPGTPTNLTASVSGSTGTLRWSTPAANGSPISGYTIRYATSPLFPELTTLTLNVTGTTGQATVSSLPPGSAWYVQVRAVNAVGSGAWSTTLDLTIPYTRPGSPTVVATVASLTSVRVGITAPAQTGGLPITGYTVYWSPNSDFSGARSTSVAAGDSPSVTLSGLTAGVTYWVKASATTSWGTGLTGTASSVLLATTPGFPSRLTVTARSSSTVSLSWQAPAANGSPILGYMLLCTNRFTGATCTVTSEGTGTSATVTGLTSGNAYQFQVAAFNAVGTGTAGGIVYATPGPPPAVPGNVLVAEEGASSAIVTWDAATTSSWLPVTSYTVTFADNEEFTGATTIVTSQRTATLTGLTGGTPYWVRVAATSAAGTGTASSPTRVLLGVPEAPTITVMIEGFNGAAQVTWTIPALNGATYTGFELQECQDLLCSTDTLTFDGVGADVVRETVYNGSPWGPGGATDFYVRVRATSDRGPGAWSALEPVSIIPYSYDDYWSTGPDAPVVTVDGAYITWTTGDLGTREYRGFQLQVSQDLMTPSWWTIVEYPEGVNREVGFGESPWGPSVTQIWVRVRSKTDTLPTSWSSPVLVQLPTSW